MSLITCEHLTFSYENLIVVKDISFQVNEGDYLCIVGENGSGKTTLMKGMLGLKKPLEGKIYFGEELKSTEIGYLPQQSIVQKDFPASVFEVVLSGTLNSKSIFSPFYTKKDKDKAKKNIELLGIKDIKNSCYRDLSGGQQQRVLLARALCATSKLLLLDEPVTGLDPIGMNELYELIRKLNQEKGITIVMISHDINSAIDNAKTILHLNEELMFYGDSREYANSQVGQLFLKGDRHV